MSNVIAVNDASVAGGIVYWSLGGTINVDAFRLAWVDAGLDPALLPPEPTEGSALKRAMLEQAGRRLLARPINRGKTWLLVSETPNGSDADYSVRSKVELQKDGTLLIHAENGINEKIESAYANALSNYDVTDIANWLVHRAYACQALALRPRGGVYFIPRANIDTFLSYVSVLNKVSADCNVYRIPALQSADAVQAILAALQDETSDSLRQIELDVVDCVQDRVKQSRREECNRLLAKVRFYEDLLSENLDSLKAKIENLSVSLTVSVLSDEPEPVTV